MKNDDIPSQDVLTPLHDWISNACKNGAVPVISGKNGDMDTIGSAISLAASHPNMRACGTHLGRISRRVCDELNAPLKMISHQSDLPRQLGGIVVVDAASPGQVGVSLPANVPKCIIDHHTTNSWELKNDDLYVNLPVSATAEIIARYLNLYAPETLTEPVRKLLLAGLLTDSGRFKHNNSDSFKTASILLENTDINYAEFVEWLETNEVNDSERGSLVRGLQRSKATVSGNWSIIHTYCGTLEGRLAGLLLGTGHDISLVCRTRGGETRMTARASKQAVAQGIRLSDIMSKVAQQIGGEGGGHDGAAGWTGQTDKITAETSFISHVARITRSSE